MPKLTMHIEADDVQPNDTLMFSAKLSRPVDVRIPPPADVVDPEIAADESSAGPIAADAATDAPSDDANSADEQAAIDQMSTDGAPPADLSPGANIVLPAADQSPSAQIVDTARALTPPTDDAVIDSAVPGAAASAADQQTQAE